MEREIIDSEMIQSFGYYFETGVVEIEFRKGSAVWHYFDISEIIWYEFQASESKGKYFNSNIRGKYREARIG